MLPDGQYVFDFGDIFEGPLTRGKAAEYKRSHPGGQFHTNYNLLYRFAARFKSGEAQGVAAWMESLNHYNAENYWSLLWFDPGVKVMPIERQQTWHYFPDHQVVYWRERWTPDATAFAFKCGPPEGHHTAAQLKEFPDWHLSAGTCTPGRWKLYHLRRGHTLTGDSGYAGVPLTAHHNRCWLTAKARRMKATATSVRWFSYDLLDKVRIAEVRVEKNSSHFGKQQPLTRPNWDLPVSFDILLSGRPKALK